MVSKDNESDFLVLLLLSTLIGVDKSEYAERLYATMQRRLPRLEDLRTGDKELDFLIKALIRDINFNSTEKQVSLKDFERSVNRRLRDIESRLALSGQDPRGARDRNPALERPDRRQSNEVNETIAEIRDFRTDLQSG